ncbi:TetR/AcrR family transcriptional regulator [Actinokineospora sp. G85]|uniref:TetR/AcrR family transcriptional regulator n=1 Tax=Actinokineospora sp. G85 TaxID=3406626 RepID=UPI003C742FDD
MATRARERLLQAAQDLFHAEGIRAVGVDRLLEVSGVGRASFYRHFATKDDLVVATVRAYGRHWLARLAETVRTQGDDPLAVFDALAERFAADDYRGCVSINTMVEAADPTSAAHRAAAEHKAELVEYLRGLLVERGHADAEALARHLVLLVDGAIVTALRERIARPAHQAKSLAALMLARDPA